MWDELQVLIPAGQDPYAIIDGIQKARGEGNGGERRQSGSGMARGDDALPGAGVLGGAGHQYCSDGGGIEVHVRYITRAYERHEARKRMYEAVVGMMHGKREAVKQ